VLAQSLRQDDAVADFRGNWAGNPPHVEIQLRDTSSFVFIHLNQRQIPLQ
jgi:hypothetical protein